MQRYNKLVIAVVGLLVVLGVDQEVVDAVAAVVTALLVYAVPNE